MEDHYSDSEGFAKNVNFTVIQFWQKSGKCTNFANMNVL